MIPQKPQYLDMGYSENDIQNGVPVPPTPGGKPAAAAPANTKVSPPSDDDLLLDFRRTMRGGPIKEGTINPISFRPPEALPVSPETTDALLEAIAKVHRVVTARIRYHETEAARLKASLVPFANQAPAAGPAPPQNDTLQQLLDFARALPDPEASP